MNFLCTEEEREEYRRAAERDEVVEGNVSMWIRAQLRRAVKQSQQDAE